VTEVLGDSLPAGRYRVIAQLRLNGFLTRRFSAGDVQLAAPSNERCSCQALFGCGFAAMVVVCLHLN
jgi:hypothetical protein